MSGAPLAGMFMAVIPVLVAIVANVRYQREGRGLSWGSITPPLVLIFFGLVIANWTEFQYITSSGSTGLDFWIGVLFGIAAVISWTWFSIMNGEWLLAHPKHSSSAWTALQGVTVLPVVMIAFAILAWPCGWMDTSVSLLGETPLRFLGVAPHDRPALQLGRHALLEPDVPAPRPPARRPAHRLREHLRRRLRPHLARRMAHHHDGHRLHDPARGRDVPLYRLRQVPAKKEDESKSVRGPVEGREA